MDRWRERLVDAVPASSGDSWEDGVRYVLGELAAHLRQGDLLPGGKLYEQNP